MWVKVLGSMVSAIVVLSSIILTGVFSDVRENSARIGRNETTLVVIDERLRVQSQMQEWNGAMLRKLLAAQGMEPPPKPALPESAMQRDH